MTLDQTIALTASFAAALSAFATFLTVRQMSKQREASYRPELMFASRFVSVRTKEGVSGPPDQWHETAEVEGPDKAVTHFGFGLDLINVGLGTAKFITLTWSFPIEKTISNVNDLAQKALAGVFIEYKGDLFTIKSKTGGGASYIWKNQQKAELDYVLPANSSSSPSAIMLPSAYLVLLEMLVHFAASAKQPEAISWASPLNVDLHYSDIGGREVDTALEINFELGSIHNSGERFDGRFVSRRRTGPSLLDSIAAEVKRDLPSVASTVLSTIGVGLPRRLASGSGSAKSQL